MLKSGDAALRRRWRSLSSRRSSPEMAGAAHVLVAPLPGVGEPMSLCLESGLVCPRDASGDQNGAPFRQ